MVHHVVDTAIQLHGALGLLDGYPAGPLVQPASARSAWSTAPDEVHRWTVGRNVIKAFQATGTTASMAGGDLV